MISEQSCVHFDFPVAPHSATLLFRFSQRSSGNNNDNTTSWSMRLKQLKQKLATLFCAHARKLSICTAGYKALSSQNRWEHTIQQMPKQTVPQFRNSLPFVKSSRLTFCAHAREVVHWHCRVQGFEFSKPRGICPPAHQQMPPQKVPTSPTTCLTSVWPLAG